MARGVSRKGYAAVSGVDDPSSSSSTTARPARVDDWDQDDLHDSASDTVHRPLLDNADDNNLDDDDDMVGTQVKTGNAVAIPFVGKGARLNLKSRANRYRWLCIFLCSFSGDGWTYESSVMSAIISLPAYVAWLGYGDQQYLPAGINSWIGPVYSLGQLFGGIAAAYVGDWFGRKAMLLAGALLVNLCTALLVWSPNTGVVIFARVVEGVSIGFLLLGYQLYAVEISNRNERGFLSGLSLVTGNIFSLMASAITYGLTYANGNWGWRLAFSVSFIPANILIFALPWIAESPRWLYKKKGEEAARAVFLKLHANNEGELDEFMEREYDEMKLAIEYDTKHKLDEWKHFFNTPAARYRTFVAVSSQFIWAWNGQSVWTYYFTYVFDSAGFSDVHIQFALNSIQGAMWVVGSTIGAYLLDVLGRKFSFLAGIGQMAIFLFIQGGLAIGIFDKGITNHSAGIAFVSFYIIQWALWVTFFSSVVNMYPAELFPAPLRARGYAMANVVSMAVGFASQYSGFPMYTAMKGWTWIFFGFCMVAAFLMILFIYPETKNLSLEEVECVFQTGAGAQVKKVSQFSMLGNATDGRGQSFSQGKGDGVVDGVHRVNTSDREDIDRESDEQITVATGSKRD